jgi:hypothetical protein
MRLDCSACLDGKKKFDLWHKGGECPYENARFQRVANFKEKEICGPMDRHQASLIIPKWY